MNAMLPADPIEKHFRLLSAQKAALKKLGVLTVRDLCYHFPSRHTDAGGIATIKSAEDGDHVTIYGKVARLETKKSFRGGVPMAEGSIRDASGTMRAVWFHQPYLAKMFAEGDFVRLSGVVKKGARGVSIVNPEMEKAKELPGDVTGSLFSSTPIGQAYPDRPGLGGMFPVYPESRGITSRWFYHAIGRVFKSGIVETLEDPIPADILLRYKLPSLHKALHWIHMPREEAHALAARKRFAFEEIFLIQLERQRARRTYETSPAFPVTIDRAALKTFTDRLGFSLTGAQKRAIDTILMQFSRGTPMLRLLEGDVGSGKTAVAAVTAAAVVTTRPKGQDFGNLQVAYMCPTEILATQQFDSFVSHFVGTGIQVGLITGSGCRKFPSKVDQSQATDISRTQLQKWVANGEIPILIGTHALIQKSVRWKHLAYAIIDEQHRFGTAQRAKLVQKDGRVPHLLSMTATPIPRTLALTLYGDLDLTLLDEMPRGRKPVVTEIVTAAKRRETYEAIRRAIKEGRQAYVICPRIDEPDPEKEMALQAKDVTSEAKRLKAEIFPEFTVGVLHGKMTPRAKDKVMGDFASGKTHILVATSVVEVGVNVPNATVIMIEGAERFGLAQLHQLRGRVIRSSHQSYCYLFTEAKAAKSWARLKALATAKNGFALAEMDLALRGAGELSGGKQWGMSDIGMEAIRNIKLVEAARDEAAGLLDKDVTLAKYPVLHKALTARMGGTHGE